MQRELGEKEMQLQNLLRYFNQVWESPEVRCPFGGWTVMVTNRVDPLYMMQPDTFAQLAGHVNVVFRKRA